MDPLLAAAVDQLLVSFLQLLKTRINFPFTSKSTSLTATAAEGNLSWDTEHLNLYKIFST